MVSAGRQGQAGQASLGLESLNNVGRLWVTRVLSSCLVPGPGVVRAGGYWFGGCEIQEVVRDMGFALVVLCMKGVLPIELFAISRK